VAPSTSSRSSPTSSTSAASREIVTAIAEARDLERDRVVELIDGAPYTAQEALDLGLVDALEYPDQFADYIDERTDGATLVNLTDYGAGGAWNSGPQVAVVFAQGVIRRGYGGVEPWTGEISIGSRDFGRLLRELGDDESVSAVVLRIDSPGGSALASDLILREAELLGEKKPLIISMSDVAASGGYYIATKARHIVAEEATLTGSIGVYGGKLVTREFEKELLGISHDPLQRGANADIYSSLAPFSPEQSARLQTLMRRVYDDFVGHVARGRGMTPEAVEEVAQGRVWTGRRASEIGLVDQIGGLDLALSLARQEAGIEADADIQLDFYPRPPELLDYLLGRAQPFLPLRVPEVIRLFEEDHFRLLQLPPGVADLANPF
jgi:protease-4